MVDVMPQDVAEAGKPRVIDVGDFHAFC